MIRFEILDHLRYQVLAPRVTTMGDCNQNCGAKARGGAACWQCLIAQLPERDRKTALDWVMAAKKSAALWWKLEDGNDA